MPRLYQPPAAGGVDAGGCVAEEAARCMSMFDFCEKLEQDGVGVDMDGFQQGGATCEAEACSSQPEAESQLVQGSAASTCEELLERLQYITVNEQTLTSSYSKSELGRLLAHHAVYLPTSKKKADYARELIRLVQAGGLCLPARVDDGIVTAPPKHDTSTRVQPTTACNAAAKQTSSCQASQGLSEVPTSSALRLTLHESETQPRSQSDFPVHVPLTPVPFRQPAAVGAPARSVAFAPTAPSGPTAISTEWRPVARKQATARQKKPSVSACKQPNTTVLAFEPAPGPANAAALQSAAPPTPQPPAAVQSPRPISSLQPRLASPSPGTGSGRPCPAARATVAANVAASSAREPKPVAGPAAAAAATAAPSQMVLSEAEQKMLRKLRSSMPPSWPNFDALALDFSKLTAEPPAADSPPRHARGPEASTETERVGRQEHSSAAVAAVHALAPEQLARAARSVPSQQPAAPQQQWASKPVTRSPDEVERLVAKVHKLVRGVTDTDARAELLRCDYNASRAADALQTAARRRRAAAASQMAMSQPAVSQAAESQASAPCVEAATAGRCTPAAADSYSPVAAAPSTLPGADLRHRAAGATTPSQLARTEVAAGQKTVTVVMGEEAPRGLTDDDIVTSRADGSMATKAGRRLDDQVIGGQGQPLPGQHLQDVLRPSPAHVLSAARASALASHPADKTRERGEPAWRTLSDGPIADAAPPSHVTRGPSSMASTCSEPVAVEYVAVAAEQRSCDASQAAEASQALGAPFEPAELARRDTWPETMPDTLPDTVPDTQSDQQPEAQAESEGERDLSLRESFDVVGSGAEATEGGEVDAGAGDAGWPRLYYCCGASHSDGAWQCNGTCRRDGNTSERRWFHRGCTRGKQHGDSASPLCLECHEAMLSEGWVRSKRARTGTL